MLVDLGGRVSLPKPPLTVHNAEIHTASVEIKTLTLKGKQVTLAVFRQLRESPLIAESGDLNGVPWGIVNYHPDKCDRSPAHWHVVWQRGSDLFRAAVLTDPFEGPYWPEEGDRFLASHVRDILQGRESAFFNGQVPSTYEGRVTYPAGTEAPFTVNLQLALPPHQRTLFSGYQVKPGHAPVSGRLADEVIEKLDQFLGVDNSDPQLTARLCAAYRLALKAEAERRGKRAQQRAALVDLPQLFIAV